MKIFIEKDGIFIEVRPLLGYVLYKKLRLPLHFASVVGGVAPNILLELDDLMDGNKDEDEDIDTEEKYNNVLHLKYQSWSEDNDRNGLG